MKVTASKGISPEVVRDAVKSLVSEENATRSKAYAALALPLLKAVDRESSIRKILNVTPIGLQEDAIFPLDTDDEVEVILSSAYGMPPVSMFMTDVVTVNTDTYQGGWELPEQLVSAGRIDQVARNQRRMLNGFINKEEVTGWALINAAISGSNTVSLDTPPSGEAGMVNLINDMLVYFQDKAYIPDMCWMSPATMGRLRLMCKEAGLPDQVRFDLWRNGMIPGLWGIDFYALRGLSDDYIYMFDSSRFGVMPERQALETREDPSARAAFKIRVYAQCQWGAAVVDKTALCAGDVTSLDA